jgi:hypothetical protein
VKFDEIGYWSEIKLDIVKDYASAYSRILAAQRNPELHHVYIDAFAGAGVHISKATGEYIPGSLINALLIRPPFREYHLIDIDRQKVALLRALAKERNDVHGEHGFHVHEFDDCSARPMRVPLWLILIQPTNCMPGRTRPSGMLATWETWRQTLPARRN